MKILFITPFFFGFDKEISSILRKHSEELVVFPEKPNYKIKLFQLFIQKLPDRFYQWLFNHHVNKINNCKISPDLILIIRAEFWQAKHLRALKNRFPTARLVLYEWDTSDNLPYLREQLPLFDEVYTFNPDDAKKFGLKLKPLFYKSQWRQALLKENKKTNKHKISFIGTDHSDRYNFIQKFKAINNLDDSHFFCHLYRTRWSFYFNKVLKRNPQLGSKKYDFMPYPLLDNDSINVFLSSIAILDINPPTQVGLSARTFEALSLNRKLITTNKNIASYDFYNPNNILIIDRVNPVVPSDFLESDYIPPSDKILRKYASEAWVEEFFTHGNRTS